MTSILQKFSLLIGQKITSQIEHECANKARSWPTCNIKCRYRTRCMMSAGKICLMTSCAWFYRTPAFTIWYRPRTSLAFSIMITQVQPFNFLFSGWEWGRSDLLTLHFMNIAFETFVPGTDSRESPTDLTPDVEALALEDAIFDHSPSNSLHSNHELESHSNQMTSSSLDLENRLLKNEVASLNQEMASLVQRAKDSQTGILNKLFILCRDDIFWTYKTGFYISLLSLI